MGATWVVRGGEGNRLVDLFVAQGVFGVGFPEVPDASTLPAHRVLALLERAGHTDPEAAAQRFAQFHRGMQVGHAVVMPDGPRKEVVVGRITGDYRYDEAVAASQHRHRREVHWIARHGVDQLPRSWADLPRQRTHLQRYDAASLDAHIEAVEAGTIGGSPRRTAAARTRSTTARPRRTTVAAPPKPAGPPRDRVCAVCFLRKPLALFDGADEVCRDCA